MFDAITIVLILLTLSAVAASGFAVLYLSKIKRGLSELGMRVLESQDVGKIKDAANKTESFGTRLAGCEQKTEESNNQLTEQKTKLNELADNLGASEQKIASFEARFTELSTKIESVEQKTGKNENDLAQTVPNIKALADEIQGLKIFQAATEKVRSQILDAFNDMQAGSLSEEVMGAKPEEAKSEESKTEEAVKGLEEWQNEDEPNRVTGSRRWQS